MYRYEELRKDLCALAARGAEVGEFGRTEFGNALYYVRTAGGEGAPLVTAAIHARENVTARIAVLQAERALSAGLPLVVAPMLDPDGALLIEKGADAFPSIRERLLALNDGNDDFSLWKANARGVDLNVNFDARFACGEKNAFFPGPENYVGPAPASERETAALCAFTRALRPCCTLSLHAKGREVIWFFHQRGERKRRDLFIAKRLAAHLRYRLGADRTTSAGGFKDWCVEKAGIPAFTVEIGSDALAHPIELGSLPAWEQEALVSLPARLIEIMSRA